MYTPLAVLKSSIRHAVVLFFFVDLLGFLLVPFSPTISAGAFIVAFALQNLSYQESIYTRFYNIVLPLWAVCPNLYIVCQNTLLVHECLSLKYLRDQLVMIDGANINLY